ncbi:MAG: 4-carboxymuconolactone decarboxylase [Pseudonocardiales bacterium]|nr:4-carboxymuconolactone decarboxylase [Pseudonocardiales bacterium]
MSTSNGSNSGDSEIGGDRYQRGLKIRREVLGDAHVDRSLAAVSEFARPVQEYVTATAWGDIWSRPGLDRRTRSLINLAMLTALNRNHELGVHVRGAVTNGCSTEEIQEVLLQAAVYCGAPAALESFRVAERVLGEIDAETAAAHASENGHG